MVIVLLLPRESRDAIRWTSLAVTILQVVLAVIIFARFDRTLAGINTAAGMQFVERATWIDIKSVAWFGRVHIEYFLGIDGLSVVMVLLTALISFIATISSWTIESSLKGYFALLLLLNTGMMGVFVALDFFLFYVFWEVMLLPMYFLIGVWGGPRREYAAIKFFLYTLLGSVLMLLAMIALYFSTNVYIDAQGVTLLGGGSHEDRNGGPGEDPHLQHDRHDGSRESCARVAAGGLGHLLALCRVCRAVHRLRHQGPALPVPYLAARCPR